MTKKELINLLKDFNDDQEILVAWSRDKLGCLEGIENVSSNGLCIQLTCESLMENK